MEGQNVSTKSQADEESPDPFEFQPFQSPRETVKVRGRDEQNPFEGRAVLPGIVIGSLIGLARATIFPNKSAATIMPPSTGAWVNQSYFKRAVQQSPIIGSVVKDMTIFVGSLYTMDLGEFMMFKLRGVEDAYNRAVGGVLGGSVMGTLFVRRFTPFKFLSFVTGGAMLGFQFKVMEINMRYSLFKEQQRLEQELMKKPASEVRQELDFDLMRQLMEMKELRDSQLALQKHIKEKNEWNQRLLSNVEAGEKQLPCEDILSIPGGKNS